MPSVSSWDFYFGDLLGALLAVAFLALVLRWASSRGGSLVARRPTSGHEGDYGLLVSVASPGSYAEGEVLRLRLEAAGVRATLARTADGPRLMVFPRDERAARRVLAGLP